MNVKRFVIGCLVTYVVVQCLGFLINTVFLGETYGSMAEVWRPEAEMMAKTWVMFLTSMLWTVLFCYIFTRGYEGKGVAEGIRYGFLIGLFWLPVAYENFVIFPIPISLAHIWGVTTIVTCMIYGAVFAAIYRPKEA